MLTVAETLRNDFHNKYVDQISDPDLLAIFAEKTTEGVLWQSMQLEIDLICGFIDLFS